MNKHYTGVGSRETPREVMIMLTAAGYKLAEEGWTLRSGAADGADIAFEKGADAGECDKEIYIPWNGFNGRYKGERGVYVLEDLKNWRVAEAIAASVHPAWAHLKQGAKKLHTRNVYQVLGQDLDTPSRFLLCWAPVDKNNIPKGGTRTAWVLATKQQIPCYNLALEEDFRRIEKWLED